VINDIQKETYVEADEKTTKALTYDILHGLYNKMDVLNKCYEDHLSICEHRFDILEKEKKRNAVISGGTGFIGGVVVMVGYIVDRIVSK
jgi:hypothetical protein